MTWFSLLQTTLRLPTTLVPSGSRITKNWTWLTNLSSTSSGLWTGLCLNGLKKRGRYMSAHHPFSPCQQKSPLMSWRETCPRFVLWPMTSSSMAMNWVAAAWDQKRCRSACLQPWFLSEEAQDQFGFLFELWTMVSPPHGGLAIGLTVWSWFWLERQHSCSRCLPKNNKVSDPRPRPRAKSLKTAGRAGINSRKSWLNKHQSSNV